MNNCLLENVHTGVQILYISFYQLLKKKLLCETQTIDSAVSVQSR